MTSTISWDNLKEFGSNFIPPAVSRIREGQEKVEERVGQSTEAIKERQASTFQFSLLTSNIEQETEIDMNDVTISIDHDVSVMSILDLKNVTSDGISSHGLDEVQPSLLKINSVLPAVLSDKEVKKVVDLGTTHFIP